MQHKNGFMSQFYSLSETITPTLAWGFLGTDQTLKDKCSAFKVSMSGWDTIIRFNSCRNSEVFFGA